jgi:hypothetical protein
MKNQVALGAILGAFLFVHGLRAQEGIICSNATMSGTYVSNGSGISMTPNGPVPVTSVGKVTYNGDGTGVLTFSTTSTGGTLASLPSPVSVTYTVRSDCTGSKVFNGALHMDFVISPNGRLITWIITNAGAIMSGTGVRLDNKD